MRKSHLVILPGARSLTQIGALLLFLACPNIAFVGRDRRDIQPSCSFSTMGLKWLQKKPESQFSNVDNPGFLISVYEPGEEMDFKWFNGEKCLMTLSGDNDTLSFQQVYTDLPLNNNESAVYGDKMHTLLKELQEVSVSQSTRKSELFNLPENVAGHMRKDHEMRQSRDFTTHSRRSDVLDGSALKSNIMRSNERRERINLARKMSKDRVIRISAELNTRNNRYFIRDDSVLRLNERRTQTLSEREAIKRSLIRDDSLLELNARRTQRLATERREQDIVNRRESNRREIRQTRNINTRQGQSSFRDEFAADSNFRRTQRLSSEKRDQINSGREVTEDRESRIARDLETRVKRSLLREKSYLDRKARQISRLSEERREHEFLGRRASESEMRELRGLDSRVRQNLLALESNARRAERRDQELINRRESKEQEIRQLRDVNTRERRAPFRDVFASDSRRTGRLSGENREPVNSDRRVTADREIRLARDLNTRYSELLFRDDSALSARQNQRLSEKRQERDNVRRHVSEGEIRELRDLNTRVRQNVFRDDLALELNARRTQRLPTEKREQEIVNRRESNEREIRQVRDVNTRDRQSLYRNGFALDSNIRRTQRLSGEIQELLDSGRRVREDRETRIVRDLNSRHRESLFRDDSALTVRQERHNVGTRESNKQQIRQIKDVNTRVLQSSFRDDSVLELNARRSYRLPTQRREWKIVNQRESNERETINRRESNERETANRRESNERETVNRRESNDRRIRQVRDVTIRERQSSFRDLFALESIARRTQRLSGEIREPVNSGRQITEDRETRISRDLNTRHRESLFRDDSVLSARQSQRLSEKRRERENVGRRVSEDNIRELRDVNIRVRQNLVRDDSTLKLSARHIQRQMTERKGREIVNRRDSNEREIRQIRDENTHERRSSFLDVSILDSNFRRTQRLSTEMREPVTSVQREAEGREIRIVRDLSTRVKRSILSEKSTLDRKARQISRLSEERREHEFVGRRGSEDKVRELRELNSRVKQNVFPDDSALELNVRHTERRDRELVNRRESKEQDIRRVRDVNSRERQASFRDVLASDSNFRRTGRLSGVNREPVNSDRRVTADQEIRLARDLNTRYSELLFRDDSAISARQNQRLSEKRQERDNVRRRLSEGEIREFRDLNTRVRQNEFRDSLALELNARRTQRLLTERKEREIVNRRDSNEREKRQIRDVNTRELQTSFRDDSALVLNAKRTFRLPTLRREREILNRRESNEQEIVNRRESNEREILNRRESNERGIRQVRDVTIRERQSFFRDLFALEPIARRTQQLSGEVQKPVYSGRRITEDRETRISRDLNTRYRESLFRDDSVLSARQVLSNVGRRVSVGDLREIRDLNTRTSFTPDSVLDLNARRTQRLLSERREREILNRRESNEREVRDIRDEMYRERRSSFRNVFALDSSLRSTQRLSAEMREPVNLGRRLKEDREIRIARDLNTRYRESLFRDDSILSARQSQRLSEKRQVRENVGRRVSEGKVRELIDLNTRVRQNLVREDSALDLNTRSTQRQITERRALELVYRRESNEREVRDIRDVNSLERRSSFRDVFALDSNFRRTQRLTAEIREPVNSGRLLAVRREQLKLDGRTRVDREIRMPGERNTIAEKFLIRSISDSGLNARRIHRIHVERRERENENRRVAEDREIRIARELSTRSRRSLIREVRRERENVDERVSEGKIRHLRNLDTRVRKTLFRDDSALELNERRIQMLPVNRQERENFDHRLSERRVQRLSAERRERVNLDTRLSNDREISMSRDIYNRDKRSLYRDDSTQEFNAKRDGSQYKSNERNVQTNSRRSNNHVIESFKNFHDNTVLTSKLNTNRENRMEIRSDGRYSRTNEFYRRAESQRKSELTYDNRHLNYVTLLPQKLSEGMSGVTIDWATVIQILGSALLIFLSANSNSKLSLMDKIGWTMKEQSHWTF